MYIESPTVAVTVTVTATLVVTAEEIKEQYQ